jgi:hypothetical protein
MDHVADGPATNRDPRNSALSTHYDTPSSRSTGPGRAPERQLARIVVEVLALRQ